ncbi:ABC transporter permease [Ammonicoccus fulvus]|uniref:ABC transporter permease n=1 Tax=Ammonicoccus fulvus TaxID=3138240 RepID=A0ABZ3FS20_9ACTN
MRFLAVEYAKMRRLKVWLVAGVLSLGTLLFSCMQLFRSSYVAAINDPAQQHWEGTLLWYAMAKAMTAPLLAAVLASRLVDVEHQGNGWLMAATLGQSKGRLCLTKILALAPVVLATTVFELGGLVLASRLVGATLPLPVGPWLWYAFASFAITLAILAGHVWISARVDNQLTGLAVGVLGAFAGVFTMLMPSWLAHILPWGYYAVAAVYRMSGDGFESTPIAWPAVTLFLLVLAALVALGLRRLDRIES